MRANGNVPVGLRSVMIVAAVVFIADPFLGQQPQEFPFSNPNVLVAVNGAGWDPAQSVYIKPATPLPDLAETAAGLPLAPDRAGESLAEARADATKDWGPAPPPMPTPSFLPSPGRYVDSVKVSIVSTRFAIYHYTLDGSEPTLNSPVYNEMGITITENTTIKAIATGPGFSPSDVATGVYTIITRTPTPTLNPPPGRYFVGQLLTITDPDGTATIRYTEDGTRPNAKSTRYTGPIALVDKKTIKAIAIAAGRADSEVASGTYEIVRPK